MKALTAQPQITRRVVYLIRQRADELMRVATYLAIGALVALENLASIALLVRQHVLPYVVCVAIAQEISILCSFFLNDRLTFRKVTTARRPWYTRCLRFHSVAVGGGIAIVGISTLMYHFFGFPPVIAQLIAIVTMTAVNFAAHRFWTFRSPQEVRTLTGDAVRTAEEANVVGSA